LVSLFWINFSTFSLFGSLFNADKLLKHFC